MLMTMKNRSDVDGFILHPTTKHHNREIKADSAKEDEIVVTKASRRHTAAEVKLNDSEFDAKIMDDVKDSLNNLTESDDAEPQETQLPRRRHTSKPRNVKKIIKRVILVLVLLLLLVVGYFGVKVFMAGNKVFKGNFLSVFTTKAKLKTDQNGRSNILIFGTSGYSMNANAWDGAMLTDSIMVLSVDQEKKNAYMISLPRDLYVKYSNAAGQHNTGKLNEVYYFNNKKNNDEPAGAKALMAKAGSILGLDIQYYVHADWSALTQIVDAVGGVDIKIESSDKRGIYDSGTKIRYKQGQVVHLNGERALALARARNHNRGDYGLAGGNYAREQNQQRILTAVQAKMLSANTLLNVVAVNSLIDAIGSNMVTNFDATNIQTLVDLAKSIKNQDIRHLPLVKRLDGGPDLVSSYTEGGSYKGEAPVAGVFDYSQIQKYVADNLSGSVNDTHETATIDVLNSSKTVGLAANKAETLKREHYKVGQVGNAPTQDQTEPVKIYCRNQNLPATTKALQQKYGVTVVDGDLANYKTEADFIVVFGAGAKPDDNTTSSRGGAINQKQLQELMGGNATAVAKPKRGGRR